MRYLVGNKQDLVNDDQTNREVSYEEGLGLAQMNGASFMEVSAHENINVDFLFDQVIEEQFQVVR